VTFSSRPHGVHFCDTNLTKKVYVFLVLARVATVVITAGCRHVGSIQIIQERQTFDHAGRFAPFSGSRGPHNEFLLPIIIQITKIKKLSTL
jgi:hypothetical protein